MPIDAFTVLHAPPLTRWQTADALHLALDAEAPNWAAMDERGARVLAAVDGRRTVAQVAASAALFPEPAKNLQHVMTFLHSLARAGLVTKAAVNRRPYTGREHRLAQWALRELWLHTNDSCNLTCTHCLVSSSPAGHRGQPSELLLSAIDQAKALGAERVFFTGGEPFLRKDFGVLAERATRHHGLELIILTNATLFAHPAYRALLEPLDRQRVRFQVSIDGADAASNDALRGEGTFEVASTGLSLLASMGFQTSLTVVPHRRNLASLPSLPALARKLGAHSLHLMWPHLRGRGVDEKREFPTVSELLEVARDVQGAAEQAGIQLDNFESLKLRANAVPGVKHDLGMAGVEALCLGPDGVVYPSAATVGDPALALGALAGRTLLEVWQGSPVAASLRKATLLDNAQARRDPLRFITGGGDLEHAWFWSGDLAGDDPWAPLVATLTRDAIEDFGRAGRARVNLKSGQDVPVLFHSMGEGALACGDEVPGAVRTLHSNCVLAFDVDRPRALMREYYGAAATEPRADLCCPVRPSAEDLAHIPKDVVDRFYGCGSPVQDAALEAGEAHLDLGSGAGIDVFIAARHVGTSGRSVGVDMTDAMLAVANENRPIVAASLGFDVVSFKKGMLEQVPLEDEEVDCVTSNCVVNLSPDKRAVFGEIWRVLKDHGRLVLADIVADQSVPAHLRVNPELWGECLAGALTEAELLAELERAGFHGVEVLKRTFWREVEGCTFSSVTVRGWKSIEPAPRRSGHRAVYRGPWKSVADEQGQVFRRNESVEVSEAAAARLSRLPYSGSFDVYRPDNTLVTTPQASSSCCG
jgi:MoaA/NifB/PqqE/SkfB family radical SAM enzyme/SAM-dependent methyltransferase